MRKQLFVFTILFSLLLVAGSGCRTHKVPPCNCHELTAAPAGAHFEFSISDFGCKKQAAHKFEIGNPNSEISLLHDHC